MDSLSRSNAVTAPCQLNVHQHYVRPQMPRRTDLLPDADTVSNKRISAPQPVLGQERRRVPQSSIIRIVAFPLVAPPVCPVLVPEGERADGGCHVLRYPWHLS
jgi:hypothetical protein